MISQSEMSLACKNTRMISLVMASIFGAIFTACLVDASYERGRLSSIPSYDDVVYFESGTKLLESFRFSGIHGVVRIISQYDDIMHSPFSEILAAMAFATLGYNDSSPYIFNYIVILLYLFFLSYLLRELPLLMRFAVIWFFLTLPFATMAVVEFRPDPCWAILIGFCAVFGISSRDYLNDWRQPAIHAMLFALSLLVKPSTFAMTIIIFGLSALYRIFMEWPMFYLIKWRVFTRITMIYIFIALTVAGPYFIFFGDNIWSYFWENLFGVNKSIWDYQGNLLEQFTYYISNTAAASNIGTTGWIAGFFFLIGAAIIIAGRDTAGIRLVSGLWGVVITTYLISSLAKMKSPFLGGAFYSTFIFGTACLMNNIFKSYSNHRFLNRFVLTGICFALAIYGMLFYEWPEYSGRMNSKNGRNLRYVGEIIISEISTLPLPKNSLIVFTQSGPVVWRFLVMRFLQLGHSIQADNLSFKRDIKCFKESIQVADIVFVQDQGMIGASLRFPSESFQEEFRAILNRDPRFELFKKIKAMDGKYVYVFINKRIKNPVDNDKFTKNQIG